MWEYYNKYVTSIYHFDRGSNNSELVFDATTRKVSKTTDQGLEENDTIQNTPNLQPVLCTKSNKNGNRYFLKFDGTQRMVSSINLNAVSGAKDLVNVFIVHRMKAFDANTYWTLNGLFGHNNKGHDKFVSFSQSGDLIILGTTNNITIVGSTQPLAGVINKWVCLSIHWDSHTIPAGNCSSVYCNGQKLYLVILIQVVLLFLRVIFLFSLCIKIK